MTNHKPAKLYALSTCFHCKALIEFLEGHEIDFIVINLDEIEGKERRDMFKELKRINPLCTFPTLLARGQVVVGYNREEIKKTLNISITAKNDRLSS